MTVHSGAGASGTRAAGGAGAVPAASTEGEVTANPWYRRRAWLVAAALVVVVAVTVLTDLPQHSSPAGQISDDASVMSQVTRRLAPMQLCPW